MGKFRDIVAKVRRPKGLGGDIRSVFSMTYSVHNRVASKYKWYDNWHQKPYASKVHFSALGLCLVLFSSAIALGVGQVVSIPQNKTIIEAQVPNISLAGKENSGLFRAKSGEHEVLEKREENFKTFDQGNGKYRVVGSVGPIHYKNDPLDTTEQFKEIKLNILPHQKSDSEDWDYSVDDNGYQVRVWNNRTVEQKDVSYIAQFRRAGKYLEMAPSELVWENSAGDRQIISAALKNNQPVVDNNNYTITWQNVFGPGVDFRYNISPDKFFKTVIVNKKDALSAPVIDKKGLKLTVVMAISWDSDTKLANHFSSDSKVIGLESASETEKLLKNSNDKESVLDKSDLNNPSESLESSSEFSFKDLTDKDLWWSGQPKAWDSGESKHFFDLDQKFIRTDKNVFTNLSLDAASVDSSDTVYPLYLDTVITQEQVGTSLGDVRRAWLNDIWQTNDWLVSGSSGVNNVKEGCAVRFTTVPIPSGVTVSAATLGFYAYPNAQGADSTNIKTKIRAQAADNAAIFSNQADFDARFPSSVTTAYSLWDSFGAVTDKTLFTSPDIANVVQEVVNRAGWVSDNSMVFFWDDYDQRSTVGYRRVTYSYDNTAANAPVFNATYYTPSAGGGTISGTCKQNDKTTNCANSETVRVAINGVLQAGTGTTSTGAWSVNLTGTLNYGDVATVFVDGVADTNEAVAVTKLGAEPATTTGVVLYERQLTLGGTRTHTITNSDIALYDNSVSGDEDIYVEVDASSNLLLPQTGTSSTTDQTLYVMTNATYQPASAGGKTITTPKLFINTSGTITADSNTFDISADTTPVTFTGTFSAGTSTFKYNATTNNVTTALGTYYNLEFGSTSDSSTGRTFTLGGATTVSNVLTVGNASSTNSDTFSASSYILTLSGSSTPFVVTSKGAFTYATSTVNYLGSSSTNITALTYYNMGVGTTSDTGTGVTYTLLANTTVNNVTTVGNASSTNSDTLAIAGYTFTVGGTTNTFVITAKGAWSTTTGTVNYVTTAGNANIAAGTYYNLGVGTTTDSTTGRTFTMAGSITVNNTITVGNATSTNNDTFSTGASAYILTLAASGTTPWNVTAKGATTLSGSSTVNYIGSSATTVRGATYYSLGVGTTSDAGTGVTYTMGAASTIANLATVGNASSTSSDTLALSSYKMTITKASAYPFSITAKGIFDAGTSEVEYYVDNTTNVSPLTYYNLTIDPVLTADRTVTTNGAITVNNNFTFMPYGASNPRTQTLTLAGALSVTGALRIEQSSTGRPIINTSTSNYAVTAGTLNIGAGGNLFANNSTVTVNANATVTGIYGGMVNSNLSVAGNITVSGKMSTIGTVTLTKQNDASATITSGGSKFPNLVINASGSTYTLQDNIDVYGNLTLTAGTLDASASGNRNIRLTGNWLNNGGTFTARSGTVQYIDFESGKTITPNSQNFNNFSVSSGGGGYTKSLFHFDGDNASTTFTDETAEAWNYAGAAALSTTQKKFGATSLSCNGSTSWLTKSSSVANYQIGNNDDFTIDTWVYLDEANTLATRMIAEEGNGTANWLTTTGHHWVLFKHTDAKIYFQYNNAGAAAQVVSSNTLTATTWTHITVVRTGGFIKMYIGGTERGTAVTPAFISLPNAGTAYMNICSSSDHTASQVWKGYIDEFRFQKGVGRWGAAFTSPAAAYSSSQTISGATTITGNYIQTGGSVTAPAAGSAFNIAGNFTNAAGGTFLDNSGTLTLNGSALQTVTAGGTDASHDFNNLTLTNNSANGVSFADSVTVSGTFTDITPSSKAIFHSGSTYAFNAINIDGQATGTRATLTSSSAGVPWNLNITAASPTASNVSVQDSNANKDIDATSGGYDATGNTHWLFPSTGQNINITGSLYTSDLANSTKVPSKVLGVSVNGGAVTTGSTDSNGDFSLPVTISDGQTVAIFIKDEIEKGSIVFKAPATISGDIASTLFNVGYVKLSYLSGTEITNATLAVADNSTDADLMFSVSAGTATFSNGVSLLAASGKTYLSGGGIVADNVRIAGTLNLENNAMTVHGSWDATSGTFSRGGTSIVTFDASTTGKTILTNGHNFDGVTFNNASGGWSFSDAVTLNSDLTMTAGTLSGTNNITVNGGDVTGNGTIAVTGGTFLIDGVGNFGGTTNWSFNNLTFGDGSGSAATTKTSTNQITTAGVLTIATAQTLDAADDTWNLSGAGTTFVPTGTFTQNTSTFIYSSASAENITGSTYYNLQTNHAGTTFTIAGSTTITNVLTISTGILDGSSQTIILTASGTPFVNNDTFTASTSTVRYTGAGDTNVIAANYYNLETKPSATNSVNKGVALAGGTSKVSASANAALNISTNLTLESWVYLDSDAQNAGIIYKGDNGSNQGDYNMSIYSPGGAVTVYFYTNGTGLASTSTMSKNVLHHVACTYDGTYKRIWLDGSKVGEVAYSTPIATNNYPLNIGNYYSGGYGLTGKIYQTRISSSVRYTTTFSPTKQWVNDGATAMLWNYEEGSGPNINDDSSNNIDGTASGSYSWVNAPAGESAWIYTLGAGTFNVTGSFTNGDGSVASNVNATTYDSIVNIDGSFNNAASATYVASDSAAFYVASDFTLNTTSTFTHSSGGLLLDGQGLQTVTMNGTAAGHNFNNLTITNADSTNGVVFADSITTTGTFTDVTASSKVTFHSGSTYAFNAININGQATGTRITLTSSSAGNAWNLNITASSPSASNVSVKDSNANKDIDATTGGFDATGNTHWLFPVAITISGTVYTAENKGANIGANKTINLSINGAASTTVETGSGGTFSFTNLFVAANNPVLVYISGETEKGSLVTQTLNGTSNITGLEVFTSHVVLTHVSSGPMTNTLLATADNVSDSDSLIAVDGSSVATFATGNQLWIPTGKTYTPGGAIIADDVHDDGTLTLAANAATIHGSWDSSAGNFSTSGTVTFDASSGTETLNTGGVGVSEGWTVASAGDSSYNGTYSQSGTYGGQPAYTNGSKWLFYDYADMAGQYYWFFGPAKADIYEGYMDSYYYSSTATLPSTWYTGMNGTPGAPTVSALPSYGGAFTNLTKSGGGSLQLTGSKISITGTLTTATSNTFDLNGQNLTLVTLANNGTLKAQGGETVAITNMDTDSGTVEYTGSSSYSSLNAGVTYYGLKFNGSGTWTLAADTSVNEVLNIEAGTFSAGSKTMTLSGSGTPLVVAGTLSPSGTVTYTGSSATNVTGTTYGNLKLNYTGTTFTAAGNMSVAGVLTIQAGTFDGSDKTITLSGTGTPLVNSDTFTASNSTIKFTGPGSVTVPTVAYYNLEINNDVSLVGQPYTLTDGLAGYWKMDEASGTNVADSVGGNTGTATSSDPSVTTGNYSNARSFSGSSSANIAIPDNSSLDPSSAITISAWINVTGGDGTYRTVVCKPTTAGWGGTYASYCMRLTSANTLEMWVNNGADGADYARSTSTIIAGSGWKYVTGTFDGSTETIYINGSANGTPTSYSASITNSAYPLTIGSHNSLSSGEAFYGNIDDVRIYNRALSTTEISNIYNGTIAGTYAPAGNLTVANSLTMAKGTFTSGSNDLNIGNFIESDGVFTAPPSSKAFNVSAGWSKSGGTFTHNSGTVTFTGDALIQGATTFNNFNAETAGKTLSFESGATQIVSGTWTVNGSVPSHIILQRYGGSGQWNINPTSVSINGVTVSNSNNLATDAIAPTNSTNGGGNTNWDFGGGSASISGTVFTAENGSTNIGANKTVALSINGAAATTVETASDGTYNFPNLSIGSNNTIAVYISGETEKGSTVTQASNGSSISGVDIYTGHIVLSHQTAGPVTNTILATADNVADSDLLVAVSGSSATFTSGNKIWIKVGKTYTPGGTVAAGSLEILSTSTFTPEANTVTLSDSGTPFIVTGTFNQGTSTIIYTGSSATNVAGTTYNNLTVNQTGTTFTSTGSTTIAAVFTIQAGAFDASSQTIILSGSGTPFVKTGTFTSSTSTIRYTGAGDTTVVSTTYNNLETKASATAGGGGWTLTNTGDSNYNGDYAQSGTYGSSNKPAYTNGSRWLFSDYADMPMADYWCLSTTKQDLWDPWMQCDYYGASADLPGTWYAGNGASPVPTFNVLLTGYAYTFGSGAMNVLGNYVNGDGTNGVKTTVNTNDPTFNIDGNFTNSALATFTASNSADFSVASNFADSGKFVHSSATLTLDGQGTQTVNSASLSSFNNLSITNTAGPINESGATKIDGTLTINSGTIYNLNGQNLTLATLANDGTLKLQGGETTVTISSMDTNSGLVEYTGSGTYTTMKAGNSYYDLKISGAGSWTLGADLNANSINESAGTLNASTRTITLSGSGTPLILSGTFNQGTSTVIYTGSSATNVAGTTYNNLTVNQTGTTFTSIGSTTIAAVFTIQAGTFDASSQTIILSGSGTPFVKTGTFTSSTSTVKYTSNANTTITATTYNNLETSPSENGIAPYTVSGAGDTSYNGIYTASGTHNGQNTYTNGSRWLYYNMHQMPDVGYEWVLYSSVSDIYDPGMEAAYYDGATLPGTWYYNGMLGNNPAPSLSAGSAAITYTFASGTTNINGNYTNGDGTHALTTTADANDPTLNIDGNFSNTAGSTFVASASGTFSIASDYTNSASGIFTDSSGTLTLDGQGLQTITAGGTNSDHDFNNLTITNASAGGVSLDDSLTVAGTFTDTTASSKVTFHSGSTYAFNAISINGQADGTRITLTSSTSTSAWNLNITASSPAASYVSVRDSNANKDIDATTGGNDLTGNTHWLFPTGNSAPVNDSLTFTNPYSSNIAISDSTTEWNFRALVTDSDGPTNLATVDIGFANSADSTTPYNSLRYRWTEATDSFSEVYDTQAAATITSTSSNSNASGNQWTLDFKIKFNSSFATTSTNYAAELYAVDDSAASDTDNYSNIYQVQNLSLTFSVDSNSLNFGSLLPGSVITGTTQTTVTTNYPNGYSLAASDNIAGSDSCLANGSVRVADYAGTIASPTLWSGIGLGISLYSATGKNTTQWGSGSTESDSNNKYAGVPQNATAIHSKSGSPTLSDVSNVGYKLVVPNTQKTGSYSGDITYTVTGALN